MMLILILTQWLLAVCHRVEAGFGCHHRLAFARTVVVMGWCFHFSIVVDCIVAMMVSGGGGGVVLGDWWGG